MAVFSDLPNELVSGILSFVEPADLENFAQVARRVQELARPLLQVHREMIRKYHKLSMDNAAMDSLLKAALTDPRMGHYTRVLKLDSMMCGSSLDGYIEDEVASIRSLAGESRYLVPDADDRCSVRLKHDITHDPGRFRLALLLSLIPNLETLTVDDAGSEHLSPWVKTVIENAPSAVKPLLTKLTKIQAYSYPLSGISSANLVPFAALPSVKDISVSGSVTWYSFNKLETFLPNSKVTKLELSDEGSDSETLCTFLRSFPKLQTFALSVTSSSPYQKFDVSPIRDNLLASTKTTLQTLTILGPIDRLFFMGSLREFEVLTTLHTTWTVLLPTMRHRPSTILPRSLLRLHLSHTYFPNTYTCDIVVQDILSGKLSGDLGLDHLTFEASGRDNEPLCREHLDLQRDCREKGLNVSFPLPQSRLI